jgi:drug/metabolite transporter (DMT)-like permease
MRPAAVPDATEAAAEERMSRGAALRGHAAMALFPLLVAGSFSLGGLVAQAVDPVALTAVRFLIATLVVGGAGLATGQLTQASLRAPWRHLLLGGLYVVYFVTMFEALRVADPVPLAAVFTLTPALSAAIGWLWLRQRITGRMALALAIGAAGAVWVVFRADVAALLAFRIGWGERLFFLGCIAHAAYPVASRRLTRGDPPLAVLTGVMIAGTALLWLWGWPEIAATDWAALPALVWAVILYLAVMSGAVTFFLVQYAAQRLPGAKVMAYTYLTPAWVVGLEIALGHGAPPVAVAAGVGLTVLALGLLLKDEG